MSSISKLLKDNSLHRTLYWICKEWKILPTDPRFKDLTLEQIDWLVYWNENFTKPPTKEQAPEDLEALMSNIEKVDDNQIEREQEVNKKIDKVQEALRILEQGGDVSDWEDVTKEFLPMEG